MQINQVNILKGKKGTKATVQEAGGIIFEDINTVWQKSESDIVTGLGALSSVFTSIIRGRLKDYNHYTGNLKYIKPSLFKASYIKRKTPDGTQALMIDFKYDFPKAIGSRKKRYGYFFADANNKVNNVDSIRRWLKKKVSMGMNVYYLKRTKGGYEEARPTKRWHWNSAVFAIINASKKEVNNEYRPRPRWWKLSPQDTETRSKIEGVLTAKGKGSIATQFKKGWNKLPRH